MGNKVLVSLLLILQTLCSPITYETSNGTQSQTMNRARSANSPIAPKILGGKETTSFMYPWIASIQFLGRHICGGVMVSPTQMLTAASCSDVNRLKSFIRVEAHRHDLSNSVAAENGFKFSVQSILVHPEHDGDNNDIAIWTLKLIKGEQSMAPVRLEVEDGTFSQPGTTLKVAGWGRTGVHTLTSSVLLEAQVDVLADSECSKAYPKLKSSSLCAQSANQDTCSQDAGGPLFSVKSDGGIILVGITSSSKGCGDDELPGIYAKVNQFSEWILSNIQ